MGSCSYFGDAVIRTATNLSTVYSFIPEFEADLPRDRLAIDDFSNRLRQLFMTQWIENNMPTENYQGTGMTYIVSGFNKDALYGSVYQFTIP